MTEGSGGWTIGDVRVTSAKPLTNGPYKNGGVRGGGVNVTLVLSFSVTCSEVVLVFSSCPAVEFSSCSCSMVSPFGSGDLLLFLDVEINEGMKVLPRVSSTCSDTVESKPSISATSQHSHQPVVAVVVEVACII